MTSATLADPSLSIDVPRRLNAWDKATVKVLVRNTTGTPIVPLDLELASEAGSLYAWGLDGHGATLSHSGSIEMRWGSATPARKHGGKWELLLGGPPAGQLASMPDALSRDATERLVRLDPIAAGELVGLDVPFVAMYQHGGKLTATMAYVAVDPKRLPLYTATAPAQKAFVACTPVAQLGGPIYAHHTELAKLQRTLTASAAFAVEHPRFDLADARAKAKIMSGDYGYERNTQKWILVDATRTVVIGADDSLEDLPGNWLQRLVSLDDRFDEASEFWNVSTADAKQIEERLGADKLSFAPFAFKGHASSDRFRVTFKRAEIGKLAAAMRALGYEMTELGITKVGRSDQ